MQHKQYSVTKGLTILYLPDIEQKSSVISVIAVENILIVLDRLYLFRSIEAPIILRAKISLDPKSLAGPIGSSDTFGS